jgi:hypothetical protein
MQVFKTKYALSSGKVESAEVERAATDPDYVIEGVYGFYRLGRDCFESKAEAAADAEKRRLAKIVSLRKQIEKLEKMRFSA